MQRLQSRYAESQARLTNRANRTVVEVGLDVKREAFALAQRFEISRKKRSASEYEDVANYLLSNHMPETGYFIAVELNEHLELRLGYPPIGQIMVAMENEGSESAARWIGCSFRNFPRVETAQLAFGVIKSSAMRSLVRAELAMDDEELAEYISSGKVMAPPATAKSSTANVTDRTEPEHQQLSDGIERMPRQLTEDERKGDRLFLHLQVVSSVLLLLCPVVGGVIGSWPGAAIGLVTGWLLRVWMRHSMGIRGQNPHDGFFVRMKERAKGARRGILETLIERVRRRPFTQEQCAAITKVWDDTCVRLEMATSEEEKRELMNTCDAEIKRISYGQESSCFRKKRCFRRKR